MSIPPNIETENLTLRRVGDGDRELWDRFLAASNNGTLFHDLRFYAYHPPERFESHHLIVLREEEPVALLPAAILRDPALGQRILQSHGGASVAGPVFPKRLCAATAVAVIAKLQQYASESGLDGVEMRISPSFYFAEPDDLLPFALFIRGFRLQHRWLCHVLPLTGTEGNGFSSRQARYVRAGLKAGLRCEEGPPARLDDFHRLLLKTWGRHAAIPTHSKAELETLFGLVRGQLRLFFCRRGEEALAGTLIFMLNPRVAYTFYLCREDDESGARANAVLMSYLVEKLRAEGLRYIDMGPSASDMKFNRGVANFKESIGAHGFCRDTWLWRKSDLPTIPG